MIFTAAMMGAGAALGAYQNYQNVQEQRRAKKEAERQLWETREQKSVAAKGLALGMESSAIQATDQSKAIATQAFQTESLAEAEIALSGTTGGTPLFNLASEIAANREKVASANNLIATSMEGQYLQGKGQIMAYNSQIAGAEYQIGAMERQLDYSDSPLYWGLSIGTGAAAGAQVASGLNAASINLGMKVGDKTADLDLLFDSILFGKKKPAAQIIGSPMQYNPLG